MVNKPTYEESLPLILEAIAKRRSKWKLTSISWMDFNDVQQKVLLHLYKKWEMWDGKRPLLPWLNTVINHQIINIVRNIYSNYTRPCLKCKFNQGGNLCEIYGKQSTECIDYKKWSKSKKHAYDIKLAVSMSDEKVFGEDNQFDAKATESSGFDFERFIPIFHDKIQDKLTALEKKIYLYLFIEHKSEDDTILLMGYKNGTTKTGYKMVKKVRGQIVAKAKELIKEIM